MAGQAARVVVVPVERGNISRYDPADIRQAMEGIYNASSSAEQRQAERTLAAAIARYPNGYPAGRSDIFQVASSVDPSELAQVRIDIMQALQPMALASQSEQVRNQLVALPAALMRSQVSVNGAKVSERRANTS